MKVDHIELGGAAAHFGELVQMGRKIRLQRRRVEANGLVAHRQQGGQRARLGAGEQGDLVAEADQSVGQVGHHPLRSPVEARRHGFIEGRNLGDTHGNYSDTTDHALSWRGAAYDLG